MTGPPQMRELIKSGGALTWAWAAVKFVPVARLMRKLPVRGFAEPAQGSEIDSIGRALDAWSRRLPLRTLCFERGLAAYWMLHWRRRQATLFYGAAVIDGVLKAHVWVRSGDRDVIGCENAAEFAILSQFSNDSSSSSVQP